MVAILMSGATGAAGNIKRKGRQFFSLNYRTATEKVSARPISFY